jgi:hypothetical protein
MGTEREGVSLTHLDEPLFDGADATKRDLVDYLDAVSGLILPELRGRPLSVIRVRAGQQPFMQKNLPDYAPPWVGSVTLWAESSRREVRYALCDDRRTLLWLANQRAVEYHPTLSLAEDLGRPTHLVLDIDPPPGGPFGHAVAAAHLIRRAGRSWAGRGRQDQRIERAAYLRAVQTHREAARPRAIATRAARQSDLATTAFIKKEDREGARYSGLDPGLQRDRGGGVPAAGAAGCRCSSGSLGRPGLRRAGRLHRAQRPGAAGRAWRGSGGCPHRGAVAGTVEEGAIDPGRRVRAMHEGKRRKRAREAQLAA